MIPDVHMEGQAFEGHQEMDVDSVPTFAPNPQNRFREEEKVNEMAPQQERAAPKRTAPKPQIEERKDVG